MFSFEEQRIVELARERALECGMDIDALCSAIIAEAPQTDLTGEIADEFWRRFDVKALNLNWVPERFADRPVLVSTLGRAAMAEMLGHADPGFAIATPGPGLSMPPLAALGSEEQQRIHFGRYRTDVPRWGAFAITEPQAGSDATAIRTTAAKVSGGYRLNGSKCFITNGARAAYAVVFATTDRTRGRFGIRAFLVERGWEGFAVDRVESMLGLRGSQLSVLSFNDCFVPDENMLWGDHIGRYRDAFAAAQGAWDYMRPILSSIIVGFCRRTRDTIAEHIAEHGPGLRNTWRQTDVDAYLREIDRSIYVARLLAWKAAWKHEHGHAMSKDASMAKAYSSRLAQQIVEQAMDVLGMDAFHPAGRLEKAYRDAKAFDILEGTGDMQRLMIASAQRRDVRPAAMPALRVA